MSINTLKKLLLSSDWQEIQDMLNEIMGAKFLWAATTSGASIIKYEDNHHQLCQLIRDNKEGLRRCQNSHHGRFQEVKRTSRPALSACYCGLMSFAIPIKLDSELIGVIGGYISRSEFPITVEKCAEISVVCGTDVKEVMDYAKGIKHISKTDQKQVLDQLSILTIMIPPLLKMISKIE
jgi:ligand-binding sensor protein